MSNQCGSQGNWVSGIMEMWKVDILNKAFTLFKSFSQVNYSLNKCG